MGMAVESGLLLFGVIKGAWPVLLVMFIRLERINLAYLTIAVLALLVLVSLFGYLSYRHTSFYIDETSGEFILNRGVVNKQRVVVSLSRIQQVNINQDFIHKIFDIYSVGIETAGSTKSEATINAISGQVARELQARLLEIAGEADSITPNESELPPRRSNFHRNDTNQHMLDEDQKPFIHIGLHSLFKIGITSRYLESVSLLAAFFYAIYSNVKDIWWSGEEDEEELNNLLGSFFTLQAIGVLLGGFIVFILLFNLVRTVVTYYGFTIRQRRRSLIISYGLFNTKNTIINPSKVQLTKVTQNYFQKKMNLAQLSVHQPSSDIHLDKKARITIPGCNQTEEQKIFAFIYGEQPEKGFSMAPNWRKMIPALVVAILMPLLAYLVVGFLTDLPAYLHAFAAAYVLVAAGMIYLSFRNLRLFVSPAFIIRQSGIWDITTEYLEPHKIQAISSRQMPWHRKRNIGHITLHTAGGDLSFVFGNFSRLQALKNEWLYQVESSAKEWM